jgi:hypothetical protein
MRLAPLLVGDEASGTCARRSCPSRIMSAKSPSQRAVNPMRQVPASVRLSEADAPCCMRASSPKDQRGRAPLDQVALCRRTASDACRKSPASGPPMSVSGHAVHLRGDAPRNNDRRPISLLPRQARDLAHGGCRNQTAQPRLRPGLAQLDGWEKRVPGKTSSATLALVDRLRGRSNRLSDRLGNVHRGQFLRRVERRRRPDAGTNPSPAARRVASSIITPPRRHRPRRSSKASRLTCRRPVDVPRAECPASLRSG